jgi:hypothetical protein
VGTRVSRVTAGTRVGLRMERRGFNNGFDVVCGGTCGYFILIWDGFGAFSVWPFIAQKGGGGGVWKYFQT